jgi:hypothetical protein
MQIVIYTQYIFMLSSAVYPVSDPRLQFHPISPPTSLPLKSFVCHSYENCRGVPKQFPFWFTPSREGNSPLSILLLPLFQPSQLLALKAISGHNATRLPAPEDL